MSMKIVIPPLDQVELWTQSITPLTPPAIIVENRWGNSFQRLGDERPRQQHSKHVGSAGRQHWHTDITRAESGSKQSPSLAHHSHGQPCSAQKQHIAGLE